jgi:hypothetical protein
MSNGGFDGAPRRFLALPAGRLSAAMLRAEPTLGLFPLHSVLLPGATLSLRVFEAPLPGPGARVFRAMRAASACA